MYGYFSERTYTGEMPCTDLAAERRKADTTVSGIDYTKDSCRVGYWERIRISTKNGEKSIGRPIGQYDTLQMTRMDMLCPDEIENAKGEIADGLCRILDLTEISPERILVCGLGNPHLTPDSIGYSTAERVKPTMHIKEWDSNAFRRLGCAEIAVISPGVSSSSGLDAAVIIRGICDMIRPDAVIAIDALATRDTGRLGSTVQICNTGIAPGSGLGNPRLVIGKETIGVPVIAVGVPTVIDTRVLSGDAKYTDTPMFVSPKEINEIVSSAADIISGGINRALGIYS